MSQTIGKVRSAAECPPDKLRSSLVFCPTRLTILQTRAAYHRLWYHASLSSPTTPPLGRLASRIAIVLMGKHKPTYDPSTDCGDYVVATDCAEVFLTGKKMKQKTYYSHTTRPGSLKAISAENLMKKWGGGEILRRAVRGMLPKNRLRDVRMQRLKGQCCHSLRSSEPVDFFARH